MGFGALKKLKENAFKRSGSGGTRVFRLNSGEKAIIRFLGRFEKQEGENDAPDPGSAIMHTRGNPRGGWEYEWCGRMDPEHAGCCYCYISDSQSKEERKSALGIKTKTVALFYVKDYRKQHRFDEEVSVRDPITKKEYKTKYPPCAGKSCQWCRMNNQATTNGYMPFELAEFFANKVEELVNTVRDYCLCGARDEEGKGTIGVESYSCSECGQPVTCGENGLATCRACRKTTVPNEVIYCTNEECAGAQRSTLQDWLIEAKKTGKESDTDWTFDKSLLKPPTEEELAEAEKYKPDWSKHCAPKPSEEQAALLGLGEGPFKTPGHGSRAYGAQQEDEFSQPPAFKKAVQLIKSNTQPARTQTAKPNLKLPAKRLVLGKKKEPEYETIDDEEMFDQ